MRIRFLAMGDMAGECKRLGVKTIRVEFLTIPKEIYKIPMKNFFCHISASSPKYSSTDVGVLLYSRQKYHECPLYDLDEKEIQYKTNAFKDEVTKIFHDFTILEGGIIEEA